MDVQQTIAKSIGLDGRGLFHGQAVSVTFKPAPVDHGVVFVRSDLDGASVPALVKYVVKRPRRTSLKNGPALVEVVEHCLSAVSALGIDNLLIELNAAEMPAMDGSAKPFLDALLQAGLKAEDQPRAALVISQPVMVRQDDAMVGAVPCNESGMQLLYELDYGDCRAIGRQLYSFDFRSDDYAHQVAPARTFCLETEAKAIQAAGMGRHLTADDTLVIGDDGPLASNTLRFADEPARHKMLDLIGDLSLLGRPIRGRIIASRSSHALNHMLVRKLIEQYESQRRSDLVLHGHAIDAKKLNRIMPHRYPMLLIDRVLELDGYQRAVGVKNVTINEPFFQGHYPGTPIMPGVLIVEAMAQLSGVLIGQNLEHTGKLAVLLSLDHVKLRKAVTPGDQLIIEAETVRMRSRIVHMRCRAYVAEDVAAEAEVKFMLVADERP
jgi:UDP-3-O-[3-hydroxymyristoyl] N-acetylglucosamine deacetylase/3-hydroxyacyl-[acyl-carrier-protein] dehydratase